MEKSGIVKGPMQTFSYNGKVVPENEIPYYQFSRAMMYGGG